VACPVYHARFFRKIYVFELTRGRSCCRSTRRRRRRGVCESATWPCTYLISYCGSFVWLLLFRSLAIVNYWVVTPFCRSAGASRQGPSKSRGLGETITIPITTSTTLMYYPWIVEIQVKLWAYENRSAERWEAQWIEVYNEQATLAQAWQWYLISGIHPYRYQNRFWARIADPPVLPF
jgi:hypothetical protein